MAYGDLVLKLGELVDGSYVHSINIANTEIYIDDSTGDYDALTNTGGYGAPNPDRVDLALVVLIEYKASTGDELLTANSNDPLSVVQFTLPTPSPDGWVRVDGWFIEKIVGGEIDGDVRYDTGDGKVKKMVSAVWVEVTDYNDLLLEAALVTDTLNINVLVESSKKKHDVNNERFDKILTGDFNEKRDTLDRQYIEIDGRLEQGSNQFAAGNYSEFQRITEALTKFIAIEGI